MQQEQHNQRALYSYLLENGSFDSKNIARAFKAVDRADFVPAVRQDMAYIDYPLPIGYNQTISQPSTVAFMLNLLRPEPGFKILDVGSGSGWTTTLLANIVGENGRVIGLEIIPELVKMGRDNLEKYNYPWAEILQAEEGRLGLPSEGPFDRILVSASGQKLPQELIDQLKIGGRMVIPVGNAIWQIDRVSESEVDERIAPGFIFVPLRH